MKLELDSEDLEPEHRMCSTSLTTFDKFTEKVQRAIMIVGQATYFTDNRDSYNVIYNPKDGDERFEEGDTVRWNTSLGNTSCRDSYTRSLKGPMRVISVESVDSEHFGHPQRLTIKFYD